MCSLISQDRIKLGVFKAVSTGQDDQTSSPEVSVFIMAFLKTNDLSFRQFGQLSESIQADVSGEIEDVSGDGIGFFARSCALPHR